jgi:hypothetical protein
MATRDLLLRRIEGKGKAHGIYEILWAFTQATALRAASISCTVLERESRSGFPLESTFS